MKEGMHAPAPARGAEVPKVPQVPPAPRSTPAPPLPGIAVPQPRPATGRVALAPLLWSARFAGRAEAPLTAGQVETLLDALGDAVVYRRCGADSLGCLDCENVPEGRCPSHAHDLDRARAYSELALLLAARG
jgi:hypothetical protein